MADWASLLFEGESNDILPTQQRQPAPLGQDALRYGQQRRQAAQPAQRLPQQPLAAQTPNSVAPAATPNTTPEDNDPQSAWVGLMRKHNVDKGQWSGMVDHVYGADRDGIPLRSGNPALDADLSAYAKRFPGIGTPPAKPRDDQDAAAPPAMAAPQATPTAPPKAGAWADELFGDTPQAGRQKVAALIDPNAEADAPTWLGRRIQDVRGKRDPRYEGLPPVMREIDRMQGMQGINEADTLSRYALGASDKDLSKMYQEQLGRNFVRHESDANGYPIIVFKDTDGTEKKAYVNRPGLDTEDLVRGGVGALPFVKAANVVGGVVKGATVIGRMLAQGGGQAVTSVAQDAAAVATGVSDLDLMQSGVKAAVTGAGGIVGEGLGAALAPMVRKYLTEPSLYDKATGTLTEKGAAAARQAGVDPKDLVGAIAKDFAEAFAKSNDPNTAFRQAASKEFGIRRSLGEITGDKGQLLAEQQMRGGTMGEKAAKMVGDKDVGFDALQKQDIDRAVRGVSPPGSASTSMAERIAPDRKMELARTVGKDDAGSFVKGNTDDAFATSKQWEDDAWKAIPEMKAGANARATLPDYLNRVIGEFPIPPGGKAEMMEKGLDSFIAGQKPAAASQWRTADPTGDVVQFRKWMSNLERTSVDPTDKAAARAMLKGYDDWIDESVLSLSQTDPLGAAKLRTARGITRELHEIFDGKGTPGQGILSQIMTKADSPEAIVNAIFTGPTAEIKGGAMTALAHLKRAYDTYLPEASAKKAWDDIRLAYWLKMTADKGNEVKNPKALGSAVSNMLGTQASIVKALYTPAEISSMRRLAVAMNEISQKNPNTSWSAIGVGALVKDGMNAIITSLGFKSVLARSVAGAAAKPISGSIGAARATKATGNLQGAEVNTVAPSLAGELAAFGNWQQR
tara:strand:- start:1704 stop:4430 length:2727 start_codon:yes stop_codon:yes gene_type:complete